MANSYPWCLLLYDFNLSSLIVPKGKRLFPGKRPYNPHADCTPVHPAHSVTCVICASVGRSNHEFPYIRSRTCADHGDYDVVLGREAFVGGFECHECKFLHYDFEEWEQDVSQILSPQVNCSDPETLSGERNGRYRRGAKLEPETRELNEIFFLVIRRILGEP